MSSPVAASSSDQVLSSWTSRLQLLQLALQPQKVAARTYYRNVAFALTICEECRDFDRLSGATAEAEQYDEAATALTEILRSRPRNMFSFLSSSLQAQPDAALACIKAAADAAKDASEASELRALR